MQKIKEASTFQLNKNEIIIKCPVTYTLDKLGGRWKPLILFNLKDKKLRYSELKRSIPNITEKMLIQQLRELESDGLVNRIIQSVVPPFVEYQLSTKGKEMEPILMAMASWGLKYQHGN